MSPVAIVTASDSGIGQESAKELAENGFDLGITYRTDEAGAQETLEAVRAAGRRAWVLGSPEGKTGAVVVTGPPSFGRGGEVSREDDAEWCSRSPKICPK